MIRNAFVTVFSLIGRSVPQRGKHKSTLNGCGQEFEHDFDRLAAQWNDVLNFHLHQMGRNAPLGVLDVEVLAFGFAELAGPDHRKRVALAPGAVRM
jgi:hypothetical protein